MKMTMYILSKKPGFRLFVLLCVLGYMPNQLKAQLDAPRLLPVEHQEARRYEAYLLEQEDRWEHGSVQPRMSSRAYQESKKDTVFQRSKYAGTWWYDRMFATNLLAAEQGDKWALEADMLVDLSIGREFAGGDYTWLNTRGARLQGTIGSKIAFSSEIYENQVQLPYYLDSFVHRTTIIPGQGLTRVFGADGWSYGNAQSYIAYRPNTYLNVQFGQGRHFLGNGYRSLLLSDASFPAPYFRLQAEVGPLQYTYWIHQYTDIYTPPLSYLLGYRQKFNAMGYLNWKVSKRFEIGLFQSVVWQADDIAGIRRGLPWQYLNPFIFFHPVQFASGSEGNLLMGLNTQYRIAKRTFAYGQFVFDEMRIADFFSQNGAAVNKYGGQMGLKSHQAFGVDGLFLQTEINMVRPYTYTHWTTLTNYGHYGQSLAHPSGANFREFLVLADYRMPRGWFFQTKAIYIQQGLDTAGINFGSDVNQSYVSAPGGFNSTGVWILQGQKSQTWHLEMLFGRVINPKTNLQVEARCILRQQGTEIGSRQTVWLTLGLRSALRNLYSDF